ncbi:hypothetical protein, partial [Mycobacterium sp.]|uniref:hypothetical protein n=1 Tax=Mycobacterium sp. TaxID=1785 RepID=UPI00127A8379
MSSDRSAKRKQLVEAWSKHYPRPLAELIAVIAQPFDDDEITIADATVEAQKVAKRKMRELFARDEVRPSGGQIEAPLRDIARRLLDVLRADGAASLCAERLDHAISLLNGVAPARREVVTGDLVIPE